MNKYGASRTGNETKVSPGDLVTLNDAFDQEREPLASLYVAHGLSKAAARGRVLSDLPALANAQLVAVKALKSGYPLRELLEQSRERRELVGGVAKHVEKARATSKEALAKAIRELVRAA
jgi:predicted lysophospholipase L1 biosynthesis ABC-type transport system permease subunit